MITSFLSRFEDIDAIIIVILLIMVVSVFCLFVLISCLKSCLFRSEKKKKVATEHEYHGTWQSKIYPQEKGSIKITFETVKKIDSDEDDEITADVSLSYGKESMYRPNQTYTFTCQLVYNTEIKHYYLRQWNFGDGQYFTLDFPKFLNKSQIGYLTSISPHDLTQITFDKQNCF